MPITITENIDSRELTDGQSATLLYTIMGTADEAAAVTSLKATAPTSYHSLVRQPVTVEPLFVDTANPAACIWLGTARYVSVSYSSPETGDSVFNFDTGGGTQHITQSLQTIASYAASGTPPNYKGAIGVTPDSVEGVDIAIPVYNFAETHYLSNATVTTAYKLTLFNLTGKVNNSSFRGLATGECLFLGASGSQRGSEDWEITFRFAGSKNVTGLMVGDVGPITKKGWEYLWVRYEDTEDSSAKVLVKRPVAAYVEKVYENASFSALGIGS